VLPCTPPLTGAAATNYWWYSQTFSATARPNRSTRGLFHGYLAEAAPPDKASLFDPVNWGTLLRATLRLAR
jgi:hypothetical protein